ncbi:MAG: L-2-hydroxyglutarate oxidase [Schleiferiaceae bacterium]
MIYDAIIIGGGIVGMATAYKYQRKYSEHQILVLEKESDFAMHQTGRNSGVIHSGVYYKPGSRKARTCTDGRLQLEAFAKEHNVAYDNCGKVIVATQPEEVPQLDVIMQRGKENGLDGLTWLNADEIKAIEPECSGIKGIRVPQTGIIDYVGFVKALRDQILKIQPQSEILVDSEVVSISNSEGGKEIKTQNNQYTGKTLISCGGLQADRLAKLDGLQPEVRIVPFRGDYYDLTESGIPKVKHLIYPVPNPEFPFLGVHFTRMIHGGVECGPNAVFSFAREGYTKTSFNLKDSIQSLGFSGTWKLFAKHWKHGMGEYHRAFSKAAFLKALQRLIPSLTDEDIIPARAGIRAQALDSKGKLVDDFSFAKGKNSLHVMNAPSPAATACLAIADEILEELNK